MDHDRKREVEVKVFELRDRLEDEGDAWRLCLTKTDSTNNALVSTKKRSRLKPKRYARS